MAGEVEIKGHDEIVCHAVAQNREDMLLQLKYYLDQLDTLDDCVTIKANKKKDDVPTGDVKDVCQYPAYWLKALSAPALKPSPTITSCNVFETRLVSEKSKMEPETACSKTVLVESDELKQEPPWKSKFKSMELRGGRVYVGCDCVKYNGMQDKCLRKECSKKQDCMNRPYPLCPPSKVYSLYQKYKQPTTRETQTPCCPCVFEKEYVPSGEFMLSGCECTCHFPAKSFDHVSW